MATYTSTTALVNAPPRSSTLRLTLRESERESWDNLLRNVQSEFSTEYILRPLQEGNNETHLSEEECDKLNENTRRRLNETLERIKNTAEDIMMIKPTDHPTTQSIKLVIQEKFVQWVCDLADWFLDKLKTILAQLKVAFQWCVRKAKELIQSISEFFI